MHINRLLAIIAFVICSKVACPTPAAAAEVEAQLKQVLLLGDEVMFAYEPQVRQLLKGHADCTFVAMPKVAKPDWQAFCEQHVNGVKWDAIHFSYGRELMLHVDSQGHAVKNPADGKPLAEAGKTWGIYRSLIEKLVKSGSPLIGCTITPVRGKMPGYAGGVDWTYAGRFSQLLGPYGVKINDLRDYTRTRLGEMVQKNSNQPTKLGEQLMAEQVAGSILESFNEGQDLNRPRILLVGDSIVGGYYGATRDRFARTAIVYSDGTTYNDAEPNWKKIVDGYIEKGGERGWDVIQFNWGLHAIKYVDKNNRNSEPGKPGAHLQFTPETYAENLELFVNELKRTKAKLVFATTTPVPKGCDGSIQHLDLETYNGPATQLMAKHGIVVNDLYTFTAPRLGELQKKDDVHFTFQGSEIIAEQNFKVLSRLLEHAE